MSWSWLGFGSSDVTKKDDRPAGKDGYKAPDRNARTLCWESRDLFFDCLDKHNIVDSIKNDEKARAECSSELQLLEKDCAGSWVTYFKKRRIADWQKEQTIKKLESEGADVSGAFPELKNRR